jgi:hypothetical protein
LNFIEKAKEKMDTEITAVTIPEANMTKIEEIAANLDVEFRKREYIPCFW